MKLAVLRCVSFLVVPSTYICVGVAGLHYYTHECRRLRLRCFHSIKLESREYVPVADDDGFGFDDIHLEWIGLAKLEQQLDGWTRRVAVGRGRHGHHTILLGEG